ncbi:MAG: amidohydrolase family protein [Bacteroidota bacterium]
MNDVRDEIMYPNNVITNQRWMAALLALFCLAWVSLPVQAQIPEKAEYGKFAITNATVHTITNGVIESGVVLINNGEIEFVGENAKISADYKRINASGKHVYPGFFDSGTTLGLKEIGAVAVTNDQAELGSFNPQIRAFSAINPNSANIPVTRTNGVTNVIAHPVSGRIAGKATLIDLYGDAPDSMAVNANAALHLDWPSAVKGGWWDDRKPEEVEKDYQKALKELNDFWKEAAFYNQMMTAYEQDPQGKTKPVKDPKLGAMREVILGYVPVMINVDKEKDILNAIEWAKEHPNMDVMFSSVEEGWRVADQIAEAGIPCLVGPILRTPSRDYDNYQRPYQNAGLLHEAGVKVAIRTGGTENVRNLLYNTGYAATYGLGQEEALKAVTINPAEIFGVDGRLGSLEAGKQANLFIADGNPFEPMTQIEQVFIRGFKVPMVNRHTKLYEQFLNRDVRSE